MYTINITPYAIATIETEGITEEEKKYIAKGLARIAATANPKTAHLVGFVDQTNRDWMRLKCTTSQTWRVIMQISTKREIIDVEMIMRKDDDTYNRVETHWRELNRRSA